MTVKLFALTAMRAVRRGLVSITIFQFAIGNAFAAETPQTQSRDNDTASPIKHVIVIIGENRSFDHVFATYVPKSKSEHVHNLLSEGIVTADGKPGPNFSKAAQSGRLSAEPEQVFLPRKRAARPPRGWAQRILRRRQ
jgi:phospholipase C